MVQLKRTKVTRTDLGLFHSSCIRSIMNYTLSAFHFSLPKYLTQELEQAVQKTAMSDVSYHEALVIMKFKKIAAHHFDCFIVILEIIIIIIIIIIILTLISITIIPYNLIEDLDSLPMTEQKYRF